MRLDLSWATVWPSILVPTAIVLAWLMNLFLQYLAFKAPPERLFTATGMAMTIASWGRVSAASLSGNAISPKDLTLVIFFIVAVPVVVTGLAAAIQYSKVFAPTSPPSSAGVRCASAVLVIAAASMVFAAYFANPSVGVSQK
jgi:hypothetical protein